MVDVVEWVLVDVVVAVESGFTVVVESMVESMVEMVDWVVSRVVSDDWVVSRVVSDDWVVSRVVDVILVDSLEINNETIDGKKKTIIKNPFSILVL